MSLNPIDKKIVGIDSCKTKKYKELSINDCLYLDDGEVLFPMDRKEHVTKWNKHGLSPELKANILGKKIWLYSHNHPDSLTIGRDPSQETISAFKIGRIEHEYYFGDPSFLEKHHFKMSNFDNNVDVLHEGDYDVGILFYDLPKKITSKVREINSELVYLITLNESKKAKRTSEIEILVKQPKMVLQDNLGNIILKLDLPKPGLYNVTLYYDVNDDLSRVIVKGAAPP